MAKISASLVVYRTPAEELVDLLSALQQAAHTWVLVDNSADEDEAPQRRLTVEKFGGTYLPASTNVGFGAGHNLALEYLEREGVVSEYHLVVNPDIHFVPSDLDHLAQVMDKQPEVGWIMPQVRYPDGNIQHLCKLLPTPFDLFGRRFVPKPLQFLARRRMNAYEMRGIENIASTCVPFLSGCFIFARRRLLQDVKGFAPGYFMYMEDVDLCRRFRKAAKLLYLPEVVVEHGFHRGSHHSLRLTWVHIQSAFRYFNRWGWIFDRDRSQINKAALTFLEKETGKASVSPSSHDVRMYRAGSVKAHSSVDRPDGLAG